MSITMHDCPKLLFLSVSMGVGGAERNNAEILNRLASRYSVELRTFGAPKSFFELNPNVASSFRQLPRALIPIRAILATINEIRPNVIFATGAKMVFWVGFLKKIYLINSKITLVTRLTLPPSYLGSGEKKVKYLYDFFIYNFFLDGFSKVLVPSSEFCSYVKGRVKDQSTVIYFPNVPPQIKYKISDTHASNDNIIELYVIGRIVKRKNPQFLINSASRLAQIERKKIRLIFIGIMPVELGLKIPACKNFEVVFQGAMNPPKVSSRGISLLASSLEGMSNALIESAANGMPCVSVKCRFGISEVISDAIFGAIVSEWDENEFAQAIIDVWNQGVGRKQIIQKFNSVWAEKVILRASILENLN